MKRCANAFSEMIAPLLRFRAYIPQAKTRKGRNNFSRKRYTPYFFGLTMFGWPVVSRTLRHSPSWGLTFFRAEMAVFIGT